MGRLTGATLGWLRRQLRRHRDVAAPTGHAVSVGGALGLLEGLMCDAVVHRARPPRTAAAAARHDLGGDAPHNAFGRAVIEEEGTGGQGVLALAAGLSLTGLRTAAWLTGAELVDARGSLRDLSDRLVPLVLHVSDRGRASTLAGCHAAAAGPLFVALSHDAQHAVDLTLVARRLTERALVPGVVVTPLEAVSPVDVPEAAFVRRWVGAPQAALTAPTEAQRILFGPSRPRVFPWFDPDHPVATGTVRGPEEADRARRSREVFFWAHVEELAAEAMAELAAETGRPLGFVSPYRLGGAEVILVATGADVQVARAVADAERASRRRVGVLGLPWLRPFPAWAVTGALIEHPDAAVVVVERVSGPSPGDAPLFALVEPALRGRPGPLVSAVGADVRAERLRTVCAAARREVPPARVRLEPAGPSETGLPRHDALIQAAKGAYPGLMAARLPPVTEPWPAPEGSFAIAVAAHEAEAPPDALLRMAAALEALSPEGVVRGEVRRPEPGAWYARVQVAPPGAWDPGPDAPVDAVIVILDDPGDLGHPLQALVAGGTVFLATATPTAEVWPLLPPAWRQVIRDRESDVFLVVGGFDGALEALSGWRNAAAHKGTSLSWRGLRDPPPGELSVPPRLRRIGASRQTFDSLPRFWGEVAEPRREGIVDLTPDPLAASGAVPALASALEPDPVGAPQLPIFDPAPCTGCGRCLVACPDSAIGAVAIPTAALLDAASALAAPTSAAGDEVRRNHPHLARRLAKGLAKTPEAGAVTRDDLEGAWAWLAERLDLEDAERAAQSAAFEATIAVVEGLAPAVTASLFRAPEADAAGTGELFVLAVDPRACQGCAMCVRACPHGALAVGPRTPADAAQARERWRRWEELPDTAPATVARAQADPGIGLLAGALLSRPVALAQAGGGVSEPGSGERLAVRLVAACVEAHGRPAREELERVCGERAAGLDHAARAALSHGIAQAGLAELREALTELRAGRGDLSELAKRLAAHGHPATFDREALGRMVASAEELTAHHRRLAAGEDGLGRASLALVFARGPLSEWAGRYPRHPYQAPMTVEPTSRGVELARGLAHGLMRDHVTLIAALRRADLVAAGARGVGERLATLAGLRWQDLSAAERAGCPPLLLIGDQASLSDEGFGWLTRLLAGRLPVKVVMLDGRSRLDPAPEPALLAMAHRTAFVLAGSIAYPDHLSAGLAAALSFDGPAFVHLHAPSPRRLGFASEDTLEVARGAVHARAHVLVRYDPRADGVFGGRASLAGNPALGADAGDVDYVAWARGLGRFAAHFDADGAPSAQLTAAAEHRRGVWRTLREITGERPAGVTVATAGEVSPIAPATGSGPEPAMSHLAAEREASAVAVARLTERLLALAGYGDGGRG